MSCYQSASAVVRNGIAGPILVVNVKVHEGFVPASLQKGTEPFNPQNVFPVIIKRALPSGSIESVLQITQNLSRKDEFDFVELYCNGDKTGTRISVIIE